MIGLTLDYNSMLMDESIDSLGDDEAFEIAKDVLATAANISIESMGFLHVVR